MVIYLRIYTVGRYTKLLDYALLVNSVYLTSIENNESYNCFLQLLRNVYVGLAKVPGRQRIFLYPKKYFLNIYILKIQ